MQETSMTYSPLMAEIAWYKRNAPHLKFSRTWVESITETLIAINVNSSKELSGRPPCNVHFKIGRA